MACELNSAGLDLALGVIVAFATIVQLFLLSRFFNIDTLPVV